MKKILLADELSYCRELLSFALRHHGYEVVTAEDGLEAIEAVKRDRPDLVILESRLPRADGLTVLRALRAKAEFRDLPIFMLTGAENRNQILQAMQIGVQAYLLKSQFDLAALLARIEKCIRPEDIAKPAKKAPPQELATVIEIPGDMEEAATAGRP
jgi:DNA-binding response OmpR family regulator